VNHARAAEIQVVLEGVRLPATRDELVRYAGSQDRAAAEELRSIADREYASLDEVGEELAPVRPRPPAEVPSPREESGVVPGGEAYLDPRPESGSVRDDSPPGYSASEVVAKASERLKQQEAQQRASPHVPSAG
jgi:hypothetical protein